MLSYNSMISGDRVLDWADPYGDWQPKLESLSVHQHPLGNVALTGTISLSVVVLCTTESDLERSPHHNS